MSLCISPSLTPISQGLKKAITYLAYENSAATNTCSVPWDPLIKNAKKRKINIFKKEHFYYLTRIETDYVQNSHCTTTLTG